MNPFLLQIHSKAKILFKHQSQMFGCLNRGIGILTTISHDKVHITSKYHIPIGTCLLILKPTRKNCCAKFINAVFQELCESCDKVHMTIELFTFCDPFGRAKSYSSVDELIVVKNSLTNNDTNSSIGLSCNDFGGEDS